jgi:hypothetical protein
MMVCNAALRATLQTDITAKAAKPLRGNIDLNK